MIRRHYIAQQGDLSPYASLLQDAANLRHPEFNLTLLHCAAQNISSKNASKNIRLLKEFGADTSICNCEGDSYLHRLFHFVNYLFHKDDCSWHFSHITNELLVLKNNSGRMPLDYFLESAKAFDSGWVAEKILLIWSITNNDDVFLKLNTSQLTSLFVYLYHYETYNISNLPNIQVIAKQTNFSPLEPLPNKDGIPIECFMNILEPTSSSFWQFIDTFFFKRFSYDRPDANPFYIFAKHHRLLENPHKYIELRYDVNEALQALVASENNTFDQKTLLSLVTLIYPVSLLKDNPWNQESQKTLAQLICILDSKIVQDGSLALNNDEQAAFLAYLKTFSKPQINSIDSDVSKVYLSLNHFAKAYETPNDIATRASIEPPLSHYH